GVSEITAGRQGLAAGDSLPRRPHPNSPAWDSLLRAAPLGAARPASAEGPGARPGARPGGRAGQATNGWPDSLVMGRPAACQPIMPSDTLSARQPAPARARAAWSERLPDRQIT